MISEAAITLPRRLAAPEPGWTAETDVVIVGSGIAGLTAALHIARHSALRITLVTKDVLAAGSTPWAQGGIAAALGAGDSPEEHFTDTVVAGAGVCDDAAVRVLVREGPAAVRELAQIGARFDRAGDGSLSLTREGGHHRDRIAHAGGDATGAEIERALITRVLDATDVEVIEHALVLDLLLSGGPPGSEGVAAGGGLPGPTDAWLTLAALARETSRIRLGTLVSPATFRLPGPLAIAVAQVDAMSGGRVELGLGAGWYAAEHSAYGIAFPDVRERFDVLAEQVEIIDGLLRTPSGQTFSFTGKHYQLTDSPALPKPVQAPRPPLILGGAGKTRGAALAAKYADEFNVSFDKAGTAVKIARVRAAAAETGRELVYSAAQVLCVGRDEAEVDRRAAAIGRDAAELRENGLAGTPNEVVDEIGKLAEMGASRLYLQVLDLSDLDHLELVASEVLSQL